MNNLPVALITGRVMAQHLAGHLAHAALIAVDLGPNLSVSGSLATLLWLVALRREGVNVTAGRFLGVGFAVLTPALIAALCVAR